MLNLSQIIPPATAINSINHKDNPFFSLSVLFPSGTTVLLLLFVLLFVVVFVVEFVVVFVVLFVVLFVVVFVVVFVPDALTALHDVKLTVL